MSASSPCCDAPPPSRDVASLSVSARKASRDRNCASWSLVLVHLAALISYSEQRLFSLWLLRQLVLRCQQRQLRTASPSLWTHPEHQANPLLTTHFLPLPHRLPSNLMRPPSPQLVPAHSSAPPPPHWPKDAPLDISTPRLQQIGRAHV